MPLLFLPDLLSKLKGAFSVSEVHLSVRRLLGLWVARGGGRIYCIGTPRGICIALFWFD